MKGTDGVYSIDWEDPEVQNKIRGTIDFLVKGCTCKKGCKTNRCKCHKNGDYCGPGCECQGCVNIPIHQPETASLDADTDTNTEVEDESSVESSSGTDDQEESLETEIVTMDEILAFDLVDNV